MRLEQLRASVVRTVSISILSLLTPSLVGAADGSWTGGNGNWSDSSKWLGGFVADGANSQASFVSGSPLGYTVNVDTPRTIGDLAFDSSDNPTLAGPAVLTLDTTSGSPSIIVAGGPTGFPTISAVLAGNDGLSISGGRLSLSGQNIYSGPTIIENGTVRAVDGVGLPSASNLVFASGIGLRLETNGTFTRMLGTSPGQVQWIGSGGFGAFGGPLAVSLNGGSTLTWDTGGFVPANQALELGSPTADNVVDFQNPIELNGAQRVIRVYGNAASALDDVRISGAISNGDLLVQGIVPTSKLVLTGANSYGQTSMGVSSFTLQIGDGGTSGTLGTGSVAGGGTLAFNRSDVVNVPNAISGSLFVTQAGTGATTLSGTNTYTGTTNLDAGTLLVTGSLTGTQVNVNAGTLGGTGTVTTSDKAFTVAAGGKLAPGTSAGTLTVNTGTAALDVSAAVTATNSQSLLFELGTPSSSDQVLLTGGTLSIGTGLLEFDDFAFSTLGGFGAGTYTLFDGISPINGTLGPSSVGMIGSYSAFLTFTDGGNDLALVVPEPATLSLLALGLASIFFVRKRG